MGFTLSRPVRKHRFSKEYYKFLQKQADYMNEVFKLNGERKRAVVLKRENGYEIVIIVPVKVEREA